MTPHFCTNHVVSIKGPLQLHKLNFSPETGEKTETAVVNGATLKDMSKKDLDRLLIEHE